MNNGSSKTRRSCLVAALCCYMVLNGLGHISEVEACPQTYEEHTTVYMTVNVVNNTLQVYWENVEYDKYYLVLAGHGEVINFHKKGEGIFEYWDNGMQYVHEVIKPTKSSDFVQTGIRFNRSELDWVGNVRNHGYYVHMSTPAGIVVKKTYCMKAYPTWMNDYKSQIGDISLINLFIPGTHHSASYMTEESAVDYGIKHKYTITQGWEDVRSQLRLGARYLDIRVGRYNAMKVPFWTANGLVKMHKLSQILEQVRNFVEETNEIVIFDIHGFTDGLDQIYDHETLIDFIRERIGDLMVSPSIGWDGTLNQIWATGKRIIVCYANAEAVNLFPYHLWPTTHHNLLYIDDKKRLKNYLYSKQSNHRGNIPLTEIAALTPSPEFIIRESITHLLQTFMAGYRSSDAPYPDLKHWAQQINQDVTLWYFYDLGRTCNIVAVDYILGTNIVEVAIYWNLRRD